MTQRGSDVLEECVEPPCLSGVTERAAARIRANCQVQAKRLDDPVQIAEGDRWERGRLDGGVVMPFGHC